jgi:hypothetical protein
LVKLDETDTADYLGNKLGTFLVVDSGKIDAKVDDAQATEQNLWSASKVKKTALMYAIMFG